MKIYYRYLICLLAALSLANAEVRAQYPIADFSIEQVACKQENLNATNQSSAGIYEWDFCEGDLVLQPGARTLKNDDFNIPVGVSLIQSNSKWYGFITSLNNNSLFRVDFGNSLLNTTPTIVNLGNIGGFINAPQDVKVVEFESNYFAFINNRKDNKLIRINLGNDIEVSTASADVLIMGGGFTNGGLDVAFDGTNWVVSLTNKNYLTLVNLGDNPRYVPIL